MMDILVYFLHAGRSLFDFYSLQFTFDQYIPILIASCWYLPIDFYNCFERKASVILCSQSSCFLFRGVSGSFWPHSKDYITDN